MTQVSTTRLRARVVAIGEVMVEMAPDGNGRFAMGFAGDTFNTAWYMRRLLGAGWQVDYATAVGADALSDDVVAFMQREGIGTAHVARHPSRTVGLYLIRTRGGERSFTYWRAQSAARQLADDPAALAAALEGAAVIHLSGVTLAILDAASRARLCRALAEARTRGAHVAFDTNLRAALWPGPDAMRAGLRQGAGVADTVLPSLADEHAAFGATSAAQVIARYRAAGARTVVVKNGAGPITGWDAGDGHAQLAPPAVAQPVDTTAAGDSFAAGFLAARRQGAPLASAMASAAQLAAQGVQARGALVVPR